MDRKVKPSLLMFALVGALTAAGCAGGGAPAPSPTPTVEKTFPTATSAPARTPTTAPTPTSTTAPAPTTVPQAPGAASPAPSTPTPAPAGGNVAAGQSIFSTNCNACHPAGQAGVGPALVGITAKQSDADIQKTVRSGRGMMPPFGGLNDQQLTDLIAYLKTLR